jgi:hypothetical protein
VCFLHVYRVFGAELRVRVTKSFVASRSMIVLSGLSIVSVNKYSCSNLVVCELFK